MRVRKLNVKIGYRIWISYGNKHLLGKGGAELLRAIKETGSISAAAKKIGVSYHFAWRYIKEIERNLNQPILLTWKGGVKGGGAKLTKVGEKLLEVYERINKLFEDVIKDAQKIINEELCPLIGETK